MAIVDIGGNQSATFLSFQKGRMHSSNIFHFDYATIEQYFFLHGNLKYGKWKIKNFLKYIVENRQIPFK